MTQSSLGSRSRLTLLAMFGLATTLFGYGFGLVRVQGSSMEPTFHNGQWLLMRRTHGPSPPLHYGDVVIFRLGGDFLVKRVAGLPGDPAPGESALTETGASPSRCLFLGRTTGAASPTSLRSCPRLPNGYVYVLGDNSAVSEDSRDFGPVRASTVVGRIVP